MLEGKNGKDTE